MNWLTKHKTALSGLATIGIGVLSNPQALAAINPSLGLYATMATGALTTGIGLWNTWKQYKAAQNVIPAPGAPASS